MQILLTSICPQTGTDIQLALYYLKSYLLRQQPAHNLRPKVGIRVFNETQSAPAILKSILPLKPRLVGFSCYLWNIEKTLRVCRRLKSIDPGLKIVLGGPEASPRAREILAGHKAVDAVVRGEGEASFAELAKSLLFAGSGLSRVKGISFRKGRSVIHNPDRPQLRNLSIIPSPYLSGLVDLKDKNIVDVPLETMRGCFSRCGYCYYHKDFPAVKYFSLARIEKELKTILFHQPHEVYLMDATFNSSPERAKKILRMFIRHNRGTNLHVELRAELVDAEMAGLLYQANAYNIEIGIQSINPKTLKAVNRVFDKEKFKRGIGLLNKYKIYYEIQLIDALPFQSYGDLKRALDWLYALHPAKVIIFRMAMLPGTSLCRSARHYGIAYSPKAPYYASKSSTLSRRDLLKVEKVRFAMERLYDSQVFLKTLYALKDRAGIKISDILEDWIIWEAGVKRRGPQPYPELLNRKLPEFLGYVCRKRGRQSIYKALLPQLRQRLTGLN